MYRRLVIGLTCLVGVAIFAFFLTREPSKLLYDQEIESIIHTEQNYDGEHIDRLVSLGRDAVPAMGKVLNEDPAFPLVIVYALERMGDRRGAKDILKFIQKRQPYSDADISFVTAETIYSLHGLGGVDTAESLVDILNDQSAHMRVRLAAATVIAEKGSGQAESDAADYIRQLVESKDEFIRNPNVGVTEHELNKALSRLR